MRLNFFFSIVLLSILLFARTGLTDEHEAAPTNKEAASEPIRTKPRTQRGKAQKFEFQAEVNRLMDILINSLYSNKDIFLRELISNSADALDKIRFISLTNKKELESNPNLEIQLKVDKKSSMLTIRDTGIGMTKQELISNLGTIAKSGTSAFIEQFRKSQDLKLIGQFGVGFYSVFLVADYVEVITKNNQDKQYIWESAADGNFAISEDTENEPLGRGTQINIHLKPDSQSYLDEMVLKKLVFQYSEFIEFPISLWVEKEIEEEVQQDEEEKDSSSLDDDLKDDTKDEEAGDEEVEDEPEEEATPKKEPEKVKRTVQEWEQLNKNKAIWLRDPKECTDDQYNEFYKSITKETANPILHNHFRAEGDVEFKALLYIPRAPPRGYYDNYYNNPAALRLYVRRVFITDQLDRLLPRYLRFVRGVLDSDTLPINVSRETLQQLSALKTIGKKLVRKILDSLRKLSQGPAETDEDDLDLDSQETEDKQALKEKREEAIQEAKKKYDQFYVEYGRSIKLGVIEDTTNRQKLTKLLRFFSTVSPADHITLDDYVSRMKPEQKSIYYLTGQSREEVIASPFLEKLQKRGLEVIYMYDPMDEYVMSHLTEYEDKQLINASKEDLKLDKTKDEKDKDKSTRKEYEPLLKWWKGLMGGSPTAITDVKISQRLSTTPAIAVASKYGSSAYMEKLMKSQALKDGGNFIPTMQNQKILEINVEHPLIKAIKDRVSKQAGTDIEKNIGKIDQKTIVMAQLVTDSAILEGGFEPDSKTMNERIRTVLKDYIGSKNEFEIKEAAAPSPTPTPKLSDEL